MSSRSPPPGAVPGDRRQEVRAHGAAGGGRARGLRGRGHGEAGRRARATCWTMTPVGEPHEAGVPDSLPGASSATATSSSPTPRARASWPPCLTPTPPTRARSTAGGIGSLIAFETGDVRHLRPVQRPGAGHPVHRRRRPGLRGHGGRVSPPRARTSPSTSARKSS